MLPLIIALLAVGGLALAASSSSDPEPAKPHGEKLNAVLAAVQAKQLADIRALPKTSERLAALLVAFPDASPMNADKYSSRIVAPAGGYGGQNSSFDNAAKDEFGRYYQGLAWDPGGFAAQVAQVVLPYVPGLGPAAAAALAGTLALGRGESLKDAALAAARAAIPAAYQLAFDLGVGVILQGQSPDAAAKTALLSYLGPEANAYYEQAKQTATDLGI